MLSGVDFELRPGETVAIVGPSGAGKSTLVALLLRLAEPTGGRVLVGGDDLATVEPGAWRRHTALVPQHPTLFRGTVRTTSASATRLPETIGSAVRPSSQAYDDFVSQLPDGYETVVGDGGRQLSAGQRRRLALARVFLRDAPLIVLDEPTADLDPASAASLAEAIERLRAGRTVVLVAHRTELAAHADRVVRLEGGRILEQTVAAA